MGSLALGENRKIPSSDKWRTFFPGQRQTNRRDIPAAELTEQLIQASGDVIPMGDDPVNAAETGGPLWVAGSPASGDDNARPIRRGARVLGGWQDRKPDSPSNGLPTFAPRLASDVAGIDNAKLGRSLVGLYPTPRAEQFRHLLAFILVDLATKGLDME